MGEFRVCTSSRVRRCAYAPNMSSTMAVRPRGSRILIETACARADAAAMWAGCESGPGRPASEPANSRGGYGSHRATGRSRSISALSVQLESMSGAGVGLTA